VAFTSTLAPELQDLIIEHNFIHSYLIDFCRKNGGRVGIQNRQQMVQALNNCHNFQLNSIYPNLTSISINRLNLWAFYSFLNNNFFGVNTVKINNTKGFMQNAGYDEGNTIVDYLYENREDEEAIDFGSWALDYLEMNPSVTMAQFKNWFMTPTEGQDWDYDSAFWENPNLSFPQQDLPSRDAYKAGMPKAADGISLLAGADNIYNLVGGAVLQVRNQYPSETNNTCALKVSIALNRSGVVIPNLPGKTIEGGGAEFAGKFFFLNAKALNAWMRETFGTNPATSATPYNNKHLSFTSSDGGTNGENFPNLQELQNISGIYSMITVENTNDASGHADYIYTNTAGKVTCPFNCFFNLRIKRIDVWILE
jgi:hypothetical protein